MLNVNMLSVIMLRDVAPVECSTRKLNDQKMGKFKSGITPGKTGEKPRKRLSHVFW
jgi:hypothetical protein